MKRLKKWNGRGYAIVGRWGHPTPHAYIAAYSRADARRVCVEAGMHDPGDYELKSFFSDCWGNEMEGIEPKRGLWISPDDRSPPEFIGPKESGDGEND